MRKTILGIAAGAIALSGTLGLTPLRAESENAAVVINADGCVGFIPSEAGTIRPPFFFDPDANRHRVSNSGGVIVFTCHLTIPEALVPSEVRVAEGFGCRLPAHGGGFLFTRDTVARATPGGQLRISCRVTGSTTNAP